jgi:hypothetical protein
MFGCPHIVSGWHAALRALDSVERQTLRLGTLQTQQQFECRESVPPVVWVSCGMHVFFPHMPTTLYSHAAYVLYVFLLLHGHPVVNFDALPSSFRQPVACFATVQQLAGQRTPEHFFPGVALCLLLCMGLLVTVSMSSLCRSTVRSQLSEGCCCFSFFCLGCLSSRFCWDRLTLLFFCRATR